MRTNILIDDELIERARKLTGLATKRAIVDEALRVYFSNIRTERSTPVR